MTDPFADLLDEVEVEVKPVASEPEQSYPLGTHVPRISIRENNFRVIDDDIEELGSSPQKVVIIKAAPVSRIFYATEYSSGGSNAPVCWAADGGTGVPSKEVPVDSRQSRTCFNCEKNIKGSGHGTSRACKFQQRIALMLADDEGVLQPDKAYQLALPATSVFGKEQKKMGLQTYARLIDSQNALLSSIMTELSFDEDSLTPKLCFKPFRVLEETEFKLVKQMQSNPDTKSLVSFIPQVHRNNGPIVDSMFDVVEGEGVYVRDA
jgi:hypothetical protein